MKDTCKAGDTVYADGHMWQCVQSDWTAATRLEPVPSAHPVHSQTSYGMAMLVILLFFFAAGVIGFGLGRHWDDKPK